MNIQDSLSNVKISILALRSGLPRCESGSGSETGNGTGSGSESGGENNGEILCCGVGSSCVIHSCSCYDCGYESESDRSWGSEGRPSSHGCKPSHPHGSETLCCPVYGRRRSCLLCVQTPRHQCHHGTHQHNIHHLPPACDPSGPASSRWGEEIGRAHV